MAFKYTDISDNPTKDEIKLAIKKLERLKTEQENKNSALKIILNSIYGVAGFKSFICYNKDVAQSVTKQSEDLIKYTIKIFNHFFRDVWHERHDIHKQMGITVAPQVDHDVVNYADTDSIFAVLNRVYKSTDYKGDYTQFLLDLNQFGLKAWLAQKMDEYVISFNGLREKKDGKPALNLTFEENCHRVLWTAKKKYIKDTAFKDGKRFKPLEKITVKGLEMNQSSTPKFVRGKLKEFINYILTTDGKIDINDLIQKLKAVKTEFQNIDPENICRTERISNYEKFIINDKTKIEIGDNAKPHTKGAAYYNYLLNQQKENIKNKYEPIKTSNKVQWYYTKTGLLESFAFLPGQIPYEFAPPINKDIQFETVYLGPVNTILKPLGIKNLNSSLMVFPSFTW